MDVCFQESEDDEEGDGSDEPAAGEQESDEEEEQMSVADTDTVRTHRLFHSALPV